METNPYSTPYPLLEQYRQEAVKLIAENIRLKDENKKLKDENTNLKKGLDNSLRQEAS